MLLSAGEGLSSWDFGDRLLAKVEKVRAPRIREVARTYLVDEHRSVVRFHAQEGTGRSEEHTSELQSPCNLVCRLLLEKKKKGMTPARHPRSAWLWARLPMSTSSARRASADIDRPTRLGCRLCIHTCTSGLDDRSIIAS